MKVLLNDLINFIYPPQCHLCDCKLTSSDRFVCRKCLSELPRTGFHRDKNNPMVERFAGQFPFVNATSLFYYVPGSKLSQIVQDMKYRNYPGIGKMFGKLMYKELYSTGFFNEIDYVVPVPMHWLKKAKRGYNQSAMIGIGIAEEGNLQMMEAIKMVKIHKTQTKLSKEERLKNTEGLFQVKKQKNLNRKGVLLVDDICTTGATLGAAAKTITGYYHDVRLSLLTLGVTF